MIDLIYFYEDEFKRATPACSLSDMDEDFMLRLDKARFLANVPFIVNSAFRPVDYEKLHGRSGTSQHCFGRAVDLCALTSDVRFAIVSGLIAAGFNRIGIDSRFIHVDSGFPDSSPLIWLY